MEILQQEIIREMNVKPFISPDEEYAKRTDFLTNILVTTGRKGYVLGLSGGQDSTLAGDMLQTAVENARALGIEASFHGLLLPYGEQRDRDDAIAACEFINPDFVHDLQIKPTVDAFTESYNNAIEPLRDYDKGNVKARTRMIAHYAVASHNELLVVGTDHAAEAVTGFFTKHGDGAADVLPLWGLNKRQGRQILRFIDAPELFINKTPTADLLDGVPGQADEAELGVSYDQLDDYLEGKTIDADAALIIEGWHQATRHKRAPPVAYDADA